MRILIAGGGIAGLGAALELRSKGKGITVFDRDPAPPVADAESVFEDWRRPGATQLRQSHVFLARLYTLIRDHHPKLLEQLLDAGARELKFQDSLPATLRARYRPRRHDGDLTILSCRRTTLESVMRRYAEKLPGITILTNAKVRGLLIDKTSNGTPSATGLLIERGGKTSKHPGDLIIDASGRNTLFPEWLGEACIDVPSEEAPAGIIYYTRHYRLRPGMSEPERGAWLAPSAGDLGYIKYGVFPADNNHFSVTLSVPEIELEIRKRIVSGALFDRICASLPGVMRWTDPERAEPIGKVQAMGKLHSVWREWAPKGVPLILNFFAVGDSSIRTNPLYGRGCSIGFLQGQILAGILRKTKDPQARAKLFAIQTRAALRPFYESMVRQDAAAIRLAKQMHQGTGFPTANSRIGRSLAEHGVVPAIRSEERVLRSLLRSLHMLQGPDEWMRQPRVVSKITAVWATPRLLKARFYPGRLGPDRTEMLELLRSPATA